MADKEKAEKKAAAKETSAKKPAAKKPAGSTAKRAAEEKKASAKEKPAAEEKEAAERVEAEAARSAEEEELRTAPGTEREEEMSEEDFRRLVEESLEKVTVADVVLTAMNQMASLGYLKMGLPESVNLKYRDLGQAALAIDALEGLIKGTENRIPQEALRPFRGTLANLQLNYVQLVKRSGGS